MPDRIVIAKTATNVDRQARLSGFPDEGPQCHVHLVPKYLIDVGCGMDDSRDIQEAFQCTNQSCERMFIATYRFAMRSGPPLYEFRTAQPVSPAEPPLPDTVRGVSPNFVETYTQALAAEAHGLTQLTGIGLRKAL